MGETTVPRTRGDEPVSYVFLECHRQAPVPRTRGDEPIRGTLEGVQALEPFPARAGMNRLATRDLVACCYRTVPRTRGDEPSDEAVLYLSAHHARSPHARG